MRIVPTIDEVIDSAPYRDTVINIESIEYIISLFKDLPAKESDVKKLNLRAVCVFVYNDSNVVQIEIDTYGRIRNKDIIATGSYRLINLLGINCLSFESHR